MLGRSGAGSVPLCHSDQAVQKAAPGAPGTAAARQALQEGRELPSANAVPAAMSHRRQSPVSGAMPLLSLAGQQPVHCRAQDKLSEPSLRAKVQLYPYQSL